MTVVHLTDSACTAEALMELSAVARAGHTIVRLGPAPLPPTAARVVNIHRPMGSTALLALRPALLPRGDVLCAWSIPCAKLAARIAGRSARTNPPAVILAGVAADKTSRDRGLLALACAGRLTIVVPTAPDALQVTGALALAASARKRASSPERTVVIPPPGLIASAPAMVAWAPGLVASAPETAFTSAGTTDLRRLAGAGDDNILVAGPYTLNCLPAVRPVIWAFAIARLLWPSLRLVLPWGGQALPAVRRFAEATGFGKDITIAPDADPLAVLGACDIALLCGPVTPVMLASAMSAGLAIAAPDTPAVRALTGAAQAARLFAPNLPREGSAALLDLLDQPNLRGQLAQSARALAQQELGPDRVMALWSDLFVRARRCIGEPPGPSV